MYESRFVNKPFYEVIDGKMCEFDNIDYIIEIKEMAISKGYNLNKLENFIARKEGWFGVYGEYCNPINVIEAYEESLKC